MFEFYFFAYNFRSIFIVVVAKFTWPKILTYAQDVIVNEGK